MQSSCSGQVSSRPSGGHGGVLFSDDFVRQRSLPANQNEGATYSASIIKSKSPRETNSTNRACTSHLTVSRSHDQPAGYTNTKTDPSRSAKTSNGKQSNCKRPSTIANLNGSNKTRPNVSQLRQQSLPTSLTKSKSSKFCMPSSGTTAVSARSQAGSNSHKARQNQKLMSGPSLTSLHLARRDQQRWQQSIPSKSSPKQPLLDKRLRITTQKCVRDRGNTQTRKISFGDSPLHSDHVAARKSRSSSAAEMSAGGSEIEITQVQFDLDRLPKVDSTCGSRKSSISTLSSAEFEEMSLFPDSMRAHCRCKECRDAKLQPKLKRRSIEIHLPTSSVGTKQSLKRRPSTIISAAKCSNYEGKKHRSSKGEERQTGGIRSLNHQACSLKRETSRIRETSSLSAASDDGN